jgi:hypothetical protein
MHYAFLHKENTFSFKRGLRIRLILTGSGSAESKRVWIGIHSDFNV